MKNIINSIAILILMLTASSCEEVVDLDLNTIEPLLVIDAAISVDNGCSVVISYTQDFNSTEMPASLPGANVTLTNNTAQSAEQMPYNMMMRAYDSPSLIIEGNEYTLTVEYEGKVYKATETVPAPVSIDSLYIMRIRMGKEEDPYMSPTIIFQDPPGERNYYSNILFVNNKRMKSVYINDDEYKNGKTYQRILPFDSTDNNDNELKIGDHIRIEMETLAYGSYYFLQTMSSIAAGGGVNPTGNFSGGVLGYLKAYSSSSIEKTITEEDIIDK